jgi:hypothetical protein
MRSGLYLLPPERKGNWEELPPMLVFHTHSLTHHIVKQVDIGYIYLILSLIIIRLFS